MSEALKVAKTLHKYFNLLDNEYDEMFMLLTNTVTDLMKLNAEKEFLTPEASAVILAIVPEIEKRALNKLQIKETYNKHITGK